MLQVPSFPRLFWLFLPSLFFYMLTHYSFTSHNYGSTLGGVFWLLPWHQSSSTKESLGTLFGVCPPKTFFPSSGMCSLLLALCLYHGCVFSSFCRLCSSHLRNWNRKKKKGRWVWITTWNKGMVKIIKNPYNYPVWLYIYIWKLCNMIVYDNLPQTY